MDGKLSKLLQGSRRDKTVLCYFKIFLLAAIAFIIAGCYETHVEVIDASSAFAVAGVTGTFNKDEGGTVTISAVPLSNDYRFRSVSEDNKVLTGYIRMVPLRGDIYIVQIKYDDESVYILDFYKFTHDANGARYWAMYPDVEDEKIDQLAQQNGVKIDWERMDFVPYLEGSRADIMAFLRAHSSLPFI